MSKIDNENIKHSNYLVNINEYINSLKTKDEYEFIYKVSDHIDTYAFNDALPIIKQVLNNEKLNAALSNIINDNKINVTRVSKSYKTNTFMFIISVYCDLNDMELINDSYDYDEPYLDKYINGSIKLYLKEINRYPLLTKEEEKELFIRFENGEKAAYEKLINSNLRLVVSVAKKYINKNVPFLDLIQEGNLGLMKAVDKFDVSMGYRFSTFATWCISHIIIKKIYNYGNLIKIPIHMQRKINKFNKEKEMLYDKSGEEPNVYDLALQLEISPGLVKEMIDANNKINTISLNTRLGDGDGDAELIDFISSNENSLEETSLNKLSVEEVISIINKIDFSEKQKDILFLRLGLYDGITYSLEQIGDKYNVTRERIRQIERRALERIKIYLNGNIDCEKSNEQLKDKIIKESDVCEFESCKDFYKFDPSRFNPRFTDNTRMSIWFDKNRVDLLDKKMKDMN